MSGLYQIKGSTLTGLADAIREKTGDSATLTPAEMISAITVDNTNASNAIAGVVGESYSTFPAAVSGLDTAVNTTQANLISQIMTALEGKAAGGSSVGTCTFTFKQTYSGHDSYAGETVGVIYTKIVDGEEKLAVACTSSTSVTTGYTSRTVRCRNTNEDVIIEDAGDVSSTYSITVEDVKCGSLITCIGLGTYDGWSCHEVPVAANCVVYGQFVYNSDSYRYSVEYYVKAPSEDGAVCSLLATRND